MGIYDRDYYRADGDGWWSRMAGKQTTVGLVIACGVVAVLQLLAGPPGPDPLTAWGQFYQPAVEGGQVWRLLTPLFLTDLDTGFPLWRVALTLLVLYYVGSAVEPLYGTREFLAFFLAAGFVIYLGRFLAGLLAPGIDPRAVGPGGAVTAALVLYACHHLYERWLLFFVLPVPVWALAALGVVWDTLSHFKDGPGYPPFLVGALFALAYHRQQVRITDFWDRVFPPRFGRRSVPRLSLYHGPDAEKPMATATVRPERPATAGEATAVDEQLEAKLDQVLEKVSRFGRESLTPDETRLLMRASEIYKKRRGN